MLKCRLAVVADSVVRDADSNYVSIFNVFEEVNSFGFPLALNKFYALFMLTRQATDTEQYDGRLRMTLAGVQLTDVPLRFDFQGKVNTRVMAQLNGLIIPAPGILRTSLFIGADEIGHWETAVSLVPRPPGVAVP